MIEKASCRDTFDALNKAKYALLVPIIVLGGIYGGITTPTEAGAIAVIYAFFVEFFILKTLTLKRIIEIFKSAAVTNAAIFIVVATATAFGQLLMIYSVPDLLVDTLSGLVSNKYLLLLLCLFSLLLWEPLWTRLPIFLFLLHCCSLFL